MAWKRNDRVAYHRIAKRNPPSGHRSPHNRLGCGDSPAEWPSNRVNTTTRLNKLREMMASAKAVRGIPVKAYVITSDDEHQVSVMHPKEHDSALGGSVQRPPHTPLPPIKANSSRWHNEQFILLEPTTSFDF
jgi:hypothetical protein